MSAPFPSSPLWRLLMDVMCIYKVEDFRLWSYPYEFGFVNGSLCYRTPFVWGYKWWVPMESALPMYPDVELQFPLAGKSGWRVLAELCMDTNAQDRGVDARLWRWPMEYKYEGQTWWQRNHATDREWHPTPYNPWQTISRF